MTAIENEALSDVELRELEGVLEQHKKLRGIDHGYGVFTSLCVPRLLATIRRLQRELEKVTKERDDARAFGTGGPPGARERVGRAPIQKVDGRRRKLQRSASRSG